MSNAPESIAQTVSRLCAGIDKSEYPELAWKLAYSLAADSETAMQEVANALEGAILADCNRHKRWPLTIESQKFDSDDMPPLPGWVWIRTFIVYAEPEFDVTDPGDVIATDEPTA